MRERIRVRSVFGARTNLGLSNLRYFSCARGSLKVRVVMTRTILASFNNTHVFDIDGKGLECHKGEYNKVFH
jgi:hypothetical protein